MFRPLIAAALVAVMAAPSFAQDDDFSDAYRMAAAQAGSGARLIRARPEGPATYGFYFMKNRRVVEVEIRITKKGRGEVQKVASSETGGVSEDVLKLIAKFAADKVKLPEGRLMEIAAVQLKDTPFKEMGFQSEDGKLVFAVNDTKIDPTTGEKLPSKK